MVVWAGKRGNHAKQQCKVHPGVQRRDREVRGGKRKISHECRRRDRNRQRNYIGWVYLAIVMDLYNREVLGYSVSQHIDSELVKRVLGNAIARKGGLQGAVFHSDRGTQYNSESYQRMLRENGIRQSMSRAGCPYDNACSESFFATAKKECVYLKNYATIDEVKADVFEYIELFYNRKRMHSYLGYMSPVEYRLAHSA